jgi:cytoskeletal protein CcmA (bactofilin family)
MKPPRESAKRIKLAAAANRSSELAIARREGTDMATFRPEEEDSVYIGQGAELTGAIKARGSIVIDGSFDGEIDCRHLLVGPTGVVKGKIEVSTADISGYVNAEIAARDLLAVRAMGRVEGKWDCGAIEVTRGGVLNGAAHVAETESGRRVVEELSEKRAAIIEFDETPVMNEPPPELRRVTKLQLRTPLRAPRRSVG